MNAGDRYFMDSVALHDAKRSIEQAITRLEEDLAVSAAACIRHAIIELTKTLESTMMHRLSDRSHDIVPGCEAGCGMSGDYRVCLNHSCDVQPHEPSWRKK